MNSTDEIKMRFWVFTNAISLILAAIFTLLSGDPLFLSVFAFFSFGILILINIPFLKTLYPWGGTANRITFSRLIAVILLPGLYAFSFNNAILYTGIFIFFLDGLDGYVARKTNTQSKFGAILDMETDALFVLIFTFILWDSGKAGLWLPAIGVIKYLYSIIIFLLGLYQYDKVRTRIGPAAAFLLFLFLLFPYFTPKTLYTPLLILSSSMVLLSFVYSMIIAIYNKRKAMISDK